MLIFQGSYNKGKLQSQPVKQCLSLEEIEAAGIDNTEESCIVFKAVVSENHTLISSDTPSQHQVHLINSVSITHVAQNKENCMKMAILEIHACNNPSPVFKRCILSAVASTSSQGVCEVR